MNGADLVLAATRAFEESEGDAELRVSVATILEDLHGDGVDGIEPAVRLAALLGAELTKKLRHVGLLELRSLRSRYGMPDPGAYVL